MDRYGASTRAYESDDSCGDDYPRRGGPLGRHDDFDRPHRRGNLMRERGTFRGERSGRGQLADYTSDASLDDSEFEPRDRFRASARGIRGDISRRRALSPDPLDSYGNDSEFEHGHRGTRGHVSRRGAISGSPGPRFNGAYSDDESEFEPRATRGGHRLNRNYADDEPEFSPRATREGRDGPGLRRGLGSLRRSNLRSTADFSDDDESDIAPHGARGLGGRRAMGPSYLDRRGLAPASSLDHGPDFERFGSRRGLGMGARAGMHSRRRGMDLPSDDDLDDSEDEGIRGGRSMRPSFRGSSRREFR